MAKKSQRQNGFYGGIQTGTVAASAKSIKLDSSLKVAAPRVFEVLSKDYPKLSFSRDEKRAAIDEVGASPDGGIFYYDGVPIAAFEGKHQGKGGNAIERWFKNYVFFICKNPNISYLTFATGEGVDEGGAVLKNFNTHMRQNLNRPAEYNVINPGSCSFYLSADGFEMDTVQEVMAECIVTTIKELYEGS